MFALGVTYLTLLYAKLCVVTKCFEIIYLKSANGSTCAPVANIFEAFSKSYLKNLLANVVELSYLTDCIVLN